MKIKANEGKGEAEEWRSKEKSRTTISMLMRRLSISDRKLNKDNI